MSPRRSLLVLLSLWSPLLYAQPDPVKSADPLDVTISVMGGPVWSMPRGRFPSLIIGDSQKGSGDISGDRSETEVTERWGATILLPFSKSLALDLEIGSLHYAARYRAEGNSPSLRFDVQTLQLTPTMAFTLFSSDRAFASGGIRALYICGGIDFTLATVASRVEGVAYPDSTTSVTRTGSFEGGEPFRLPVALHGGAGARIGIVNNLEIALKAGYSLGLNPIFSSDVVSDNDFTVDHFSLQIGITYVL